MWSYPMTATLDLAALKALAEAATPGPWRVYGRYAVSGPSISHEGNRTFVVPCGNDPEGEADAAYIAAMSPDVARALIERCRAAEAKLSVERIAEALFEMHAGPTSVESRGGRPIWEGFGWSRGPTPQDVSPAGMWGPKLREAFAAALLAALKGDSE
jgi:hypothetical protein